MFYQVEILDMNIEKRGKTVLTILCVVCSHVHT